MRSIWGSRRQRVSNKPSLQTTWRHLLQNETMLLGLWARSLRLKGYHRDYRGVLEIRKRLRRTTPYLLKCPLMHIPPHLVPNAN